MKDALKGTNVTPAEKPTTEAGLNDSLHGPEAVNLLQHGLAKGLKLMWFQFFFSAALLIVFLAGSFL